MSDILYPLSLIVDLNGATVFSKIDLNQGYHQLELAKDSRSITTFATHIGLFRYKRLSFGINSAAEIFQKSIEEVLQGIEGVRNISDIEDITRWREDMNFIFEWQNNILRTSAASE